MVPTCPVERLLPDIVPQPGQIFGRLAEGRQFEPERADPIPEVGVQALRQDVEPVG